MSQLENAVLLELKRSWTRRRGPVSTITIAVMLAYSDRWIRKALVDLERRGVVQRQGVRGGWLPVPA